MDVSKEILEKLKCAECDCYLSCGPVYIKHEDGEAICGRCGKPEKEPVTQNKQYETVAELLRFPCKYSEFGCQEKLQFSQNNENPHEENCDFRRRLCPVVERGTCDWLGTWKDLLQHCKEDHPVQVLENPCSIHHDITKSSLINYLLVAFNLLFILHTKICCTSGKIFHSIRFLGDSEKASDFEYQLDIKRNREQLSKFGNVSPEGCLAIQENTSLSLSINGLLEFLGGFDDVVFELSLNQLKGNFDDPIDLHLSCAHCRNDFMPSTDLTNLCGNCNPFVKYCKNLNKGCTYLDVTEKCLKHETFYCNFNSQCTFCNNPIKEGTLFKHLKLIHLMSHTTIESFTRCYITEQKQFLLTSDIGTIIVDYSLSNNDATPTFKIYTPLSSEELKSYWCDVKICTTSVSAKTILPIILIHYKETQEDWSFTALKHSSSSFFKILISIKKKDTS